MSEDPTNAFSMRGFDLEARDKELYTYLFRKLNNKLKGMIAGTKSGLEVFRTNVREQDPVTSGTEFSLRLAFKEKSRVKCADLASTRRLTLGLDNMIAQYLEKTGEPLDDATQAAVLHGAMDAETARDLRRNSINTISTAR